MARPGLHKHPKFKRLLHLLGEPTPHVRGYLEMLWDVSYENGDPVIGDVTDVALACDYPGEASKIVNALADCGGKGRAGFIERTDSGRFQIHDLYDHAPDYVSDRAQRETERKKPKGCENCGKSYRSPDSRSKYCSAACRQAAWRVRNRVSDVDVTDRNVTETLRNGTPAPAPHIHPPAPQAGRNGGGGGNAVATVVTTAPDVQAVADVRSELLALGVSSERQILRCSEVPGVTPVAIAMLAEDLERELRKGRIDSVPAVLVSRLLNGFTAPETVPPGVVARLANREKRVRRVAGQDIPPGATLTQNPRGVFWNGGASGVKAEDLKPEAIELARK